jgi:REP element-mobilizing transposase RayT
MNQAPTQNPINKEWIMMKNPSVTLGKIVRHFKAKSSFEIRKQLKISFSWQRNYFERIIRDRKELYQIRNYIKNNPANWSLDEDNPITRKI